jgi:hypothetical protein
MAAMYGYLEIVRQLIHGGCDINVGDKVSM